LDFTCSQNSKLYLALMKSLLLLLICVSLSTTLAAQGKSKEVLYGCLEGNCKDGKGIYAWEDGAIYSGDWVKGKFDGQGEIFYADEHHYIGGWKKNAFHGMGTYRYLDGAVYSGEWENGAKVSGMMTYADHRIYEGAFDRDGKATGQGKMTFPNGDVFEGPFSKGNVKSGTMTTIDGSVYSGEFNENANYNGEGKMVLKDGKIKSGEWKDGFLWKPDAADNASISADEVRALYKINVAQRKERLAREKEQKEKPEMVAGVEVKDPKTIPIDKRCEKCMGFGIRVFDTQETVEHFGKYVYRAGQMKQLCYPCLASGYKAK
jgi:hypothetical protein